MYNDWWVAMLHLDDYIYRGFRSSPACPPKWKHVPVSNPVVTAGIELIVVLLDGFQCTISCQRVGYPFLGKALKDQKVPCTLATHLVFAGSFNWASCFQCLKDWFKSWKPRHRKLTTPALFIYSIPYPGDQFRARWLKANCATNTIAALCNLLAGYRLKEI